MNLKNISIAIIGASIGGLSSANTLQRLGCKIKVFEAFPSSFHNRGGALGAVDKCLLQIIRPDANYQTEINSHGHFYGDIWQYLYQGLAKFTVQFDTEINEVFDPETIKPKLNVNGKLEEFDLIIGADGGSSIIRKYVTDYLPKYAGYTLWRTLLSTDRIDYPPHASRTVNGVLYETLGFAFTGANEEPLWNCGIYMAMPESEVQLPTKNRQVSTNNIKKIPQWFLPFVEYLFDKKTLEFWESAVEFGKVSPHPIWEFAAEKVVQNRIILLGDASHMASPRTGAGAYTAMTDAVVLEAAFKQGINIKECLKLYNLNTVARGKGLYDRSRKSAVYFAPANREIISPKELIYNVWQN